MEHDSKTLQELLADVSKKLERQEWRIVDLEKRLMFANSQEEGAPCMPSEADLAVYKEPLLKKAAVRGATSSLSRHVQADKNFSKYVLYAGGVSAVIAGVGYWMVKLV